jgi:hypothetical protein
MPGSHGNRLFASVPVANVVAMRSKEGERTMRKIVAATVLTAVAFGLPAFANDGHDHGHGKPAAAKPAAAKPAAPHHGAKPAAAKPAAGHHGAHASDAHGKPAPAKKPAAGHGHH